MQKSQLSETKTLAPTTASQEASSSADAPQPKRLVILLSLLSLYTLWGGTYLGMRIALEGFPPFFVAGGRELTGGVILFFFLRPPGSSRPTPAPWLGGPFVGGVFLVGGDGGGGFAAQ